VAAPRKGGLTPRGDADLRRETGKYRPNTLSGWAYRSGIAALLVTLAAADARAVECVTSSSSGQTACGYHCLRAEGQVRCAQTAEGVCSSSSGVVACWDPPALLRRVYERVPEASCVTNGAQTACGYHCVVGSDRAQCAQTPFGACRVNAGRLVCWDPPAEVILARGERTPGASCAISGDRVVCGYRCEVWQGVVRCAQTPDGVCQHQGGAVACWDPPLDTPAVTYDPGTERACMAASDGRSCGFRCLATPRYSGCGSDRRDACRADAEAGRVVCAAPE
jgi:hypothetical protein